MRTLAVALSSIVAAVALAAPAAAVDDPGYASITGSGSTSVAPLVEQWVADVRSTALPVSYSATGSSAGRSDFRAGTVDFAVTDIPYGLPDAGGSSDPVPARGFAYVPLAGSAVGFTYNLRIDGRQVTNLRLSGDTVAKIFTSAVTRWDDAAIQRENPSLALPARDIVPVVRSDGSGTTYQFTRWVSGQYPVTWDAFCRRQGLDPDGGCAPVSTFPAGGGGFVAQAGSLGTTGFVADTADTITYAEPSYALARRLPVVKVRNASGFYVEPTAASVSIALTRAAISTDPDPATSLTPDLTAVVSNPDPRSYPLSSYALAVVPTTEGGTFRADKGRSLQDFLTYGLCQGQRAAGPLGYAPLPANLVTAGLDQLDRVPGARARIVDLAACGNPAIGPDGTNPLVVSAPQPPACDRDGATQCTTGTGGLAGVATPISRPGGTPPPPEQCARAARDLATAARFTTAADRYRALAGEARPAQAERYRKLAEAYDRLAALYRAEGERLGRGCPA